MAKRDDRKKREKNRQSKKKKKLKRSKDVLTSAVMANHLAAIHLKTPEDYKEWCKQHGFKASLEKSHRQLRDEKSHAQRLRVIKTLEKSKFAFNAKALVEAFGNGENPKGDSYVARNLREGYKLVEEKCPTLRDEYTKLLLEIESQTGWLDIREANYAKVVANVLIYRENWLRPLPEWEVKGYNIDRQVSSLLRHLFVKYEMPFFMDKAFHEESRFPVQDWYIHMGEGNNIRTAKGLPVPLTKKMAHFFCKAPKNCKIDHAIRWGQTLGLGGDPRTAEGVLECRYITDDFTKDDFWLSVVRFFIANPMLDTAQYSPIVDYLNNQRHVSRRVFVDRGVAQTLPPPEPNLTMRGRTPDTLLRQVEAWHTALGRESKWNAELDWEKGPIPDWEFLEGDASKKNHKVWRMIELLNTKELIAEGKIMKHCVGSYGQSCHRGRVSIWSMRSESHSGTKNELTVEVQDGAVRQARGKYNERATQQQAKMLRRWSAEVGLSMNNYVLDRWM